MRRTPLTIHAISRRGQALMVAVLLMMAILLVGILFVALVSYNQSQSTRHEDTLAAQAMAEAGIRYATYMLENSPEGADWRPPEPPPMDATGAVDPDVYGPDGTPGTEDDYYQDSEIARGWVPIVTDLSTRTNYERRGYSRFPDPRHPAGVSNPVATTVPGEGYFFLRVTYAPGGADSMDWHIKIESIGRVQGSQVFRKLVAYKPIPMLNYARWVHDATEDGRTAYLGFPAWIDMDADGAIDTNVVTEPGGDPRPLEWIDSVIDGPVRVNGHLQVAGTPWYTGTETVGSTGFRLHKRLSPGAGEYPRDDRIEVTRGISMLNNTADAAQVTIIDDGGVIESGTLKPSDAANFDAFSGDVRDGEPGLANGEPRFADRIEPPTLFGDDGANFDRYRKLTRDTGDLVDIGGSFVNNGQWGFGRGIYINNYNEIQFDHDIEALMDDWQRPSDTGTPMPDSGWNALFTTYAPPAVEIEFLPTEAAAGPYESGTDPSAVGSGEVWWPYHQAGQPGIKITRHDHTWRIPEGVNAGQDSGLRTIVLDYPTPPLDVADPPELYPLIVTEGNVRVSGKLPQGTESGGSMTRAYDMVVASAGTIYIDGQLLAPADHINATIPDELNTKVALLARDCVCLNTTQIVPQDTVGTAPAVPDDPLNPADSEKHWELAPGSDGRGYSLFSWGEDPIGTKIGVVVRQTAADPGPSGVNMMTWTSAAGYQAYDFADKDPGTDTLTAPMQDTVFAFLPEGTAFPNGAVPPQPYGVASIEPDWAPYREAAADLPWLLWDSAGNTQDLFDPTPGVANALVLSQSDPHIGAGSTSYLLKKWKVAEYNDDDLPVGAISARVSAAVFAERGCWYVLTNGYFDDEVTGNDAVHNRRYNYRISFNGTIAENFTASVEAAQGWTDHLAYPAGYDSDTIMSLNGWGIIGYSFDETLRTPRFHSTVSDPTHPAANQPRLPLLPVSPDLVYYGE